MAAEILQKGSTHLVLTVRNFFFKYIDDKIKSWSLGSCSQFSKQFLRWDIRLVNTYFENYTILSQLKKEKLREEISMCLFSRFFHR